MQRPIRYNDAVIHPPAERAMPMKRLLTLLILLLTIPLSAQDADPVSLRREAFLREGPGHTHRDVTRLNFADGLTIDGRTRLGNWVHLQVQRGELEQFAGWFPTGYLMLDETVRFSEVPVIGDVPDASTDGLDSQTMAALYALPVLPELDEGLREVFALGQSLGNGADVVTKVGDSLSADDSYLSLMSREGHQLGPYDFLADTIAYYGPSLQTDSVAAQIGLSSIAVFDPFWAPAPPCEPNETPLQCEYRVRQPSVAMVLYGPNDVRSMTTEIYHQQMLRVVDESLALGVIPVLMTFSVDPDDELWWQSLEFNLALADIALARGVPLINLWAAARFLPAYGLDEDKVHLLQSGFAALNYTTGHEAFYGVSLQNLLAIRTLDEIRRMLVGAA